MSDTVRDSIYRDVISSARARDPLFSIVSAPLDLPLPALSPSYCLRVEQKLHRRRYRPTRATRYESNYFHRRLRRSLSRLWTKHPPPCHLAVSRKTTLYARRARDRQIASWHVQGYPIGRRVESSRGVVRDCAENYRIICTRVRVKPSLRRTLCLRAR